MATKTFMETKTIISIEGNMEEASNLVNGWSADFAKIQEMLKKIGINIEIHDVEVEYEVVEEDDDTDDAV